MKNRVETDIPLTTTETYEAWAQIEQRTLSTDRKLYSLFGDSQTVTWDGTNIFNMLPNGELPDGRHGRLMGAYVRPLITTIAGTANNLDGFWEFMNSYFLRIYIAETEVANVQVQQLPPFGQVKIYGDTNQGTPAQVAVPCVEGRGLPFDQHVVNPNEHLRAELYSDKGMPHLVTGAAVGLVLSTTRKQKKVVA